MNHYQSIVRNGNHFIKLPPNHYFLGDKWLLIDGPWYKFLENLRMGDDNRVFLSRYIKPSYNHIPNIGCVSPCVEYIGSEGRWDNTILWEQYYVALTETRVDIFERGSPPSLPDINHHYPRVQFDDPYLTKITFITAWLCNGGILPADLRCDIWDDNLLQTMRANF